MVALIKLVSLNQREWAEQIIAGKNIGITIVGYAVVKLVVEC